MKRALSFSLLLIACGSASAGTTAWDTGWGQGKTEFSAGDEKSSYLYFACDENDDTPVSASATIAGKPFYSHDDKGGFDVVVDGVEFSNPFYVECNACASNFPAFWSALRKAKTIQLKAGPLSSSVPVKGLSKLLPAYKAKGNPCGTGTW
jgi:hypothetical protein